MRLYQLLGIPNKDMIPYYGHATYELDRGLITAVRDKPIPLRCRLGWHQWELKTMAWEFIKAFGKHDSCIYRQCQRCYCMDYLRDPKNNIWRPRA